jgi:hypothetical protein
MSLATNLQSAFTRVGTEFKAIRTLIGGSGTANISALTTTDKTSLVAAINEVKAGSAGSPPDASSTVKGIVELATDAETLTGTDTVRATTPANVKAAIDALRTSILGAGVPAALDTLDELAAALGDDANFAASVTTALGNKQPLDADLTAIAALASAANKLPYATGAGTWTFADLTAAGRALLDDADAAAQRTTLDVYSKTEIGDPTTNFVTTLETALA